MSRKKIIIISICILMIVIAVWYILFKKPKITKAVTLSTVLPKQTVSAPVETLGDKFPLQIGSRGENVSTLQKAINILQPMPYTDISVDGDFGTITKNRLTQVYGNDYYPLSEAKFDLIINQANSNETIYN